MHALQFSERNEHDKELELPTAGVLYILDGDIDGLPECLGVQLAQHTLNPGMTA